MGRREQKNKSEVKVKYAYNISLFFKCFVFPFTLLWHMSFCSFTELYPNILLSESGVQATDPQTRLFPSLSCLVVDLFVKENPIKQGIGPCEFVEAGGGSQ